MPYGECRYSKEEVQWLSSGGTCAKKLEKKKKRWGNKIEDRERTVCEVGKPGKWCAGNDDCFKEGRVSTFICCR